MWLEPMKYRKSLRLLDELSHYYASTTPIWVKSSNSFPSSLPTIFKKFDLMIPTWHLTSPRTGILACPLDSSKPNLCLSFFAFHNSPSGFLHNVILSLLVVDKSLTRNRFRASLSA